MVQRFNLAAVSLYLYARFFNPSLLIPHLSVKDINGVDVQKLKEYGIKGIIFDKDDVLTIKYVNELDGRVKDKVSEIKGAYGKRLLIKSRRWLVPLNIDHLKGMLWKKSSTKKIY